MTSLRLSLLLNMVLAVMCVALAWQNRGLKRPPAGAASMEGRAAAPFSYHTLDGRPRALRFGAHTSYLLFVLSTTCPYCERSVPQIESIVHAVEDKNLVPLGVSIHGAPETARFAAAQHVDFDLVCADSSDAFQRSFRIDGVPTTLWIAGNGIVRRVWEGDVTAALAREIEQTAGGS